MTLNNLLGKSLRNGNLTDKLTIIIKIYTLLELDLVLCMVYRKLINKMFFLRPIISSIDTFSYKKAKYLAKILSPLAQNAHLLKDSYDFINRLNKLIM